MYFTQGDASSTVTFLRAATFSSNGRFTMSDLLPGKYDVAVYSSGRQPALYSTTVTTSKTANYSIGSSLIPLAAQVVVAGSKVQQGWMYYSTPSYRELQPSISGGTLSASGRAGTYSLVTFQLYGMQSGLQERTAYFFSWPSAAKSFVLRTGQKTNLGTLTLTVRGGL
jgi:hypothetical protein